MLSLSMIVRDEEHSLSACLESVKGFVDEIIVLDTGSVDNTVEIAKSFGAEVAFFPWTGDFVPARNKALGLVKGDWVLVLDADEQLRRESIDPLKEIMSMEEVLLVNLLRYERGSSISPYSSVSRLFRRHSNIYWSRPYHSMVDDSVQEILIKEPFWKVVNCLEPALIHDGYQTKFLKDGSKAMRLRNAMESFLIEHPGDPYASSKLGALEISGGDVEKGLMIIRNGLASLDQEGSCEKINERYELLLHLAMALADKDFQEAKKTYMQALALPIDGRINIGARLNLAALLMRNGCLEEAIEHTRIATIAAPEVFLGWFNLGLMYRHQGDFVASVNSYQQAIKLNPSHSESHKNLAVVNLLMGNISDARYGFKRTMELLKIQKRFQEVDDLKKNLYGVIKLDDFNL